MQTETLCTLPDIEADLELEARIRAEYAEMPGLKLTLPQACRLFNLERAQCERILAEMVAHGELSACCGSFLRFGADRGSR